jgi:hypothetical protein
VLGVGCAAGSPRGRWVLGVGRWVLYRAATTRSPDGILCRASLDVVLKHPSSWRRDPWGFIFGRWVFGRWVLGVGCWALGARQGHPRGSSRRRGHFTGTSIARLEAPIEGITTV